MSLDSTVLKLQLLEHDTIHTIDKSLFTNLLKFLRVIALPTLKRHPAQAVTNGLLVEVDID